MSKLCPYLIGSRGQVLMCRGLDDGTEIHQGFSFVQDLRQYQERYCRKDYHRCPVALTVNPVWRLIDDTPCPFNDGVECSGKDDCACCGWNPSVAQRRLAAFLAAQGSGTEGALSAESFLEG